MSLKFLNMKGWHPSNKINQKRIWIAEQKAKDTEQKERDAAAEIRKNADLQRFQEIAAAKGDSDALRRLQTQQVGFMYAPPPGLEKIDEAAASEVTEDDAVREFRRKMEKRKGKGGEEPRDLQRNLERYVGRRPDESLTIKDQVERFPFLKDAPVEGAYTDSVKVNFKPMGVQLRNVRCIRCGEWGHQSGDRECSLRDSNPHDAARRTMEDPMTYVNKMNQAAKHELILRKASLPLELNGAAETYDILPSEDDDDSSDPEKAFLASLSSKEKKLLLKKLKKQTKKHKRHSDSESSDLESDSERRRRKKSHKKKSKKRRRTSPSPDRHRSRGHEDGDREVSRHKGGSDRSRRHRHDRSRSQSRSSHRHHDRNRH